MIPESRCTHRSYAERPRFVWSDRGEGGKLAPLIPVGENVFAESGSSLGNLRIFLRGPGGAVERMVSRRKFADLELRRAGGAGPAPAPAAK